MKLNEEYYIHRFKKMEKYRILVRFLGKATLSGHCSVLALVWFLFRRNWKLLVLGLLAVLEMNSKNEWSGK